jgi:hypothetical protein
MRRASEHHFHTPEDVNGYLTEARKLLTAHGFKPEEQGELMTKVIELLANKHVTFEQVSPAGLVLGGGTLQG